MTTEETWKDGKCGHKRIRVKTWRAGFSIKCTKSGRTIVGTPLIQEALKHDLQTFCFDCLVPEVSEKGEGKT